MIFSGERAEKTPYSPLAVVSAGRLPQGNMPVAETVARNSGIEETGEARRPGTPVNQIEQRPGR